MILSVVILLLPACSGEKSGPPPATVPLLVAERKEQTVQLALRQIGNVEPYSTVNIKSCLAGQLVKVNFQEGQDVKQGDLLFVIDPRHYEGALRQTQANLERDKAMAGNAQSDLKLYAGLILK